MDGLKEVIDFWKCFLIRNKKLALGFFDPKAKVSFPQYDKKISSKNFVDIFLERSNFHDMKIYRAEFSGRLVITTVKFLTSNNKNFFLTSFFILDNLKIIESEHYYSDCFIPNEDPLYM